MHESNAKRDKKGYCELKRENQDKDSLVQKQAKQDTAASDDQKRLEARKRFKRFKSFRDLTAQFADESKQKQQAKGSMRRWRIRHRQAFVPTPGARPIRTDEPETPSPEDQTVTIESINVTSMEHNKKFITERKRV